MLKTLRAIAGALVTCTLVFIGVQRADAATRAYLMRGLGGMVLSTGMDQIGSLLRRHGVIVVVGHWWDREAFVADALRHPHDRIIFGGHSMGDWASFIAGAELRARHVNVRVVGLDPLCTGPVMTPGLDAVNLWGNRCGALGPVQGAKNIYLPVSGHIEFPSNPIVQRRAIAEMLR